MLLLESTASLVELDVPQGAPVIKNPPANMPETDMKRYRLNSWVGKTPWRRAWQPTPVFLPRESKDRGAWQATVHGVEKGQTQLKGLSMHTVFIELEFGSFSTLDK